MASSLDDLPCPFCGLLCDDLRADIAPDGGLLFANGCARSGPLLARVQSPAGMCLVDGAPASLEDAIARAAGILRGARLPLLLSGGADVAGMRALLALADRCAAVVDHHSDGAARNLRVLRELGWITTTLSEIRNRADVVLCVGTSVAGAYPRFFERVACPGGLFDDQRAAPRLLFLGAPLPPGIAGECIAATPEELPAVLAQLRALTKGRRPAGVRPELEQLAATLRAARYSVVVWSAAAFDDGHGELIVRTLCEWIKDLNTGTRVAGLPLAGTDGDLTALQTTLWQSGLPLRTRFGARGPEHDARRHGWRAMLQTGRADALLYLCEIDPTRAPPVTEVPAIVLGAHGMTPPRCAVFIPVGTPGVHRAGHLTRTDNVVTVRLRRLSDRAALSAPAVLDRLRQRLEAAP